MVLTREARGPQPLQGRTAHMSKRDISASIGISERKFCSTSCACQTAVERYIVE